MHPLTQVLLAQARGDDVKRTVTDHARQVARVRHSLMLTADRGEAR